MKQLSLLLPDGAPLPQTDFGSVPPGTAAPSRQFLLRNTGDEVVTGIAIRVENASTENGEYTATVQATTLTGDWTPLPDLAPGEDLLVLESWITPAGIQVTGVDSGLLRVRHYR